MARRHPARSVALVVLLLLVVTMAFAALLHAHTDVAALPVLCLRVVCVVLLELPRTPSVISRTPRPLQPSLRRVLIQLPPPRLIA